MTKLEWIIFEKEAKRIKTIAFIAILRFIVGTIAYWYLDRDIVAEGCTYIVASTGEELTEGDWMPVRPEDDDIYITPDGTYKFNRWPTCYCSYGRSYWYGAPNATERLASIAGRPVIK